MDRFCISIWKCTFASLLCTSILYQSQNVLYKENEHMNRSVYTSMDEAGEGHVDCAETDNLYFNVLGLINSCSYIRYRWVWQDTPHSSTIQGWQISFLNPKKSSLNVSLACAGVLLCHHKWSLLQSIQSAPSQQVPFSLHPAALEESVYLDSDRTAVSDRQLHLGYLPEAPDLPIC